MSSENSSVVPAETETAVDVTDRFKRTGPVERKAEDVRGVAAYVSYVWFKTQNEGLKDQIKASGGTLPTFALTRAGFVFPVKPLRAHLFHADTIATENDDSGKTVDAAPQMPKGNRNELARWAEHTFAVIGVIQGDSIVPATVSLRGSSRKAVLNADTAVRESVDDERWAKKGEQYKRTVEKTPYYPGRVIFVGSVNPQKSSRTGRDFLQGQCTLSLATNDEIDRFNKHMADPQFKADLEAVFRSHAWKLKQLIGGGTEVLDQDETAGTNE
jgi:hypothetical protein